MRAARRQSRGLQLRRHTSPLMQARRPSGVAVCDAGLGVALAGIACRRSCARCASYWYRLPVMRLRASICPRLHWKYAMRRPAQASTSLAHARMLLPSFCSSARFVHMLVHVVRRNTCNLCLYLVRTGCNSKGTAQKISSMCCTESSTCVFRPFTNEFKVAPACSRSVASTSPAPLVSCGRMLTCHLHG